MSATAYDPAEHHSPLFDLDPAAAAVNTDGEHSRKALPTVGSGLCPEEAAPKRVGVIRQGEHLVWKLHNRMTHGGVAMPCPASGATLCATGGEAARGENPVTCRHDEGGAA